MKTLSICMVTPVLFAGFFFVRYRRKFTHHCQRAICNLEVAIGHYGEAHTPTDDLAAQGARILGRIERYLRRCWPFVDRDAKQQLLRNLLRLHAITFDYYEHAVAVRPNDKSQFSQLKHRIRYACERYHCPPQYETMKKAG